MGTGEATSPTAADSTAERDEGVVVDDVGTHILLRDEDLADAAALPAASVPRTVEVVDGAFHGFAGVRPGAGVRRDLRRSWSVALRRRLGPQMS